MTAALESSLKRLQTDQLDLYYVHRMPENFDLEELASWFGRLIKEGKIRSWGVSEATAEKEATPAQISLAWVMYGYDSIVPIPGMRKDSRIIENLGAPNDAYAKYFAGNSFLNPLTKFGVDPLFMANVTFGPGCRNNWHIHHASEGGGQILICTAGEGQYQEEGKDSVSLTPGTVIVITVETKHWHGAKADSWFSHISVEVPGEDGSNEWLEAVSDEDYNKLG